MTKFIEVKIGKSGTIRVKFTLKGDAGVTANERIYVNGVARGILRQATTATPIAFSEDISISANDLVQIYAYSQPTGGFTFQLSNMSICTSLAYVPIGS